jgi:signal transduction histidine kinase
VAGGSVCHLKDGALSCETAVRAGLPLVDVAVTERGEVWVVQPGEGVRRRAGGSWPVIPASAALPSRYVLGLRTSPIGGTWVLGHGVVQRVVDAPETAGGWRVEEQLAAWLGHLVSGAADLEERPDGTLWIAHNGGLTQVPPGSRRPPARAPPVQLLDLAVAGRTLEGAHASVPDAETTVQLRFAAASYRAPAMLRYRVRVNDGAWGESQTTGTVQVQGLEPGHHRVEVAASLDGLTWTDPPASATLEVPLPWYGRWEAWTALVAVLGAVVVGIDRARAALALRMERLRTRIALDLHDQVGAGLGAIGLLAGLLARPGLPAAASAEAARRVATTADELGVAMRGIVWSLRPESARLDLLCRYLEERARATLPDLDQKGRLVLDTTSNRLTLDVDVLRGTQLIALEALHNVARHANAGWARLAVQPAGGGRWRLVIEDDGRGLGEATSDRIDGGNGLRSIRTRATDMGAVLTLGPRPGGGTRVELVFRPRRSWLTRTWRLA